MSGHGGNTLAIILCAGILFISERPVLNESQAVTVKFGLTLQQIMDVDEKNQILTTNVWLNLEWTDSNMRWNTTEYNNVKDIRVPPNNLWKPDILMYNSASEAFDSTYPTNVVVTSEGTCTYIPPGIFMSSCPMDITWFPFDDQDCEMKFGSWTYNGFKLDLQLAGEEGDTAAFIPNGEWSLLGVPAQRNEVIYDCCPEPYLDITYTFKIRRRTMYYFFNLIVPCLLIASMAVLGFTLPPDSGEKLGLCVNLLLAIVLFSTIVGEMLPVTNNTPLIGTYFNCIMFMVASSVVTTIMVLNYHHRMVDTHSMPDWVKSLFLQWLPWLLRMSRPGEKITIKTIQVQKKMKELDRKEMKSRVLISNILDMDEEYHARMEAAGHMGHNMGHNHSLARSINNGLNHHGANGGHGGHHNAMASAKSNTVHPSHPNYPKTPLANVFMTRSNPNLPNSFEEPSPCSPLQRELGLILKEIRVITDKVREDDEAGEIEADWKFAAMVLDRLCLIFFSFFTFMATAIMFSVAPHIVVN